MSFYAIDVNTASLLTGLASFAIALWQYSLRSHSPAIVNATRSWATALVLQGTGWMLMSLRAVLPLEYTVFPGTVLIFAAAAQQLRAYNGLIRGSLVMWPTYLFLTITVIGILFFGLLRLHAPARVVLTSLFGVLLGAQAAAILFRLRSAGQIGRSLAILYTMIAAMLAYRAVIHAFKWDEPYLDTAASSPGASLTSVMLFLNAVLPSVGFVHLCTQILEQNNAEQEQDISALSQELKERRTIEASILEHLDAFVYRTLGNEIWSVIHLSAGVENLTGFPAEELIAANGPALGKLIHPDDRERVALQWKASFRDGEAFAMEYRIRHKSGDYRWLADSARAVKDETGKIRHVHGFAIDITERKLAENEFELLSYLYATLSECNRVLVHARTAQEIFEGITAVCVAEGRFARVQIGLMAPGIAEPTIVAEAHCPDFDAESAAVDFENMGSVIGDGTALALRERRIVVCNALRPALPHAANDQHRFSVTNLAIAPIFGRDNAPAAVIFFYADGIQPFAPERINLLDQLAQDAGLALNRLAAEKHLAEKDQLLDFALASTIDAVWDYDQRTGKTVFSRDWEAMLGFSVGELRNDIGAWEDRVHPVDLREADERLAAYVAGETASYECELRVKTKEGTYAWIKDRGILVERDADGKPLRFVGTMKNIDAERRSSEKARRDAALLEEFFENAPVGIAIISAERRPIRKNPRYGEMFGISTSAESARYDPAARFFDEHGVKYPRGRIPEPFDLRDFRNPSGGVFGFAQGAGAVRWVEVRGTYLRDFDLVITISNDITRLKKAERREANRSLALASLAEGASLASVLAILAWGIENEIPGALASVLLTDEKQAHLRLGAAPSLPDSYNSAIDGILVGPSAGSCGTAVFRRERVIVSDIMTDPLWDDFRDLAGAIGLAACWSQPILGRSGLVLGTFAVYQKQIHTPDAEEISILESVAAIAALAIERSANERRLRESETRFHKLFDALPLGVSLYTQDWQLVEANPTMRKFSGMSAAELRVFDPNMDLFYAADGTSQPFRDIIAPLSPGAGSEEVLIGSDHTGRRRWFRVRLAPMAEIGLLAAIAYEVTTEREQGAEIERSEVIFRTLFEELPVGVSLQTYERTMLAINRQAESYLGLTLKELQEGKLGSVKYFDATGKPISFDYHPVMQALRANRNVQSQVIGFDRGTERRWVEMSVALMPSLRMLAVLTKDITDILAQQQKLKESETKFRSLFEALPVGVSLHTLDRKFIEGNAKFFEYTGASLQYMQSGGYVGIECFRADGTVLPASEWPTSVALRENRAVEPIIIGYGEPGRRRWFEVSAVVIREINLLASISKEVTHEFEQQHLLQLSEAKFRGVFELMPVGLVLLDKTRSIFEFNRRLCEISGMSEAELRDGAAQRRTYLRPGGTKATYEELPVERAFRDGKPIYGEVFGMQEGNGVRWVSASVQPIPELDLYIGILSDITEIVSARENLAAANEQLETRVAERTRDLKEVNTELEAFSYSVSHDLKAPLTRIESWANVLMDEFQNVLGEAGGTYILYMRREIADLHEMIRAMLSLAKASTTDLTSQHLDFTSLVELEILVLRDNYAKLKPDITIMPKMQAYGDPVLLTVLIRNLLANAFKFSAKRDQVKIEVGMLADTEAPTYFVRDNGDGFDMQYADKLFAPFQRMHTQKEFPGTGIGLATAQRIVHRHGGKIWIESQKGNGTTVFFTVPWIKTGEGAGE